MDKPHKYELKIYNGRVKVYIDGILFLSFNQIDYKGLYAYKNDENLYGTDLYLVSSDSGGKCVIETYYKTKGLWVDILKLLDEKM